MKPWNLLGLMVNAVQATIHAHCRILVHVSLLCSHPHAMARSPSETMYCEPMNNTSLIIVMVCLLSRTFTILTVMRGSVLLAFSNSTGRAALTCFNHSGATHWNVGSACGPL